MEGSAENTVKVRAYSPGRYPILIVEPSPGELRAAYFETGYDLGRSKTVEEGWLLENAIGRHSFVRVDPPEEVPERGLEDYARRQIIEKSRNP